MQYMWADSLQHAERMHLRRLLAWGAASVLIGTTVLARLRVRERASPLLEQFAWQTGGWGAACLVIGAALLPMLGPRDLASATRLDRFLWLNIGLDAGYVLVGACLIALGTRPVRRLGLIGAGLGVLVQGAALGVLDLILSAQISR